MQLTGSPGRFSFNGKEYDDSYGFDLYYYGARYMSPALGRFITPDPVQDFFNPYSYVGNNPLNRIDPNGMDFKPGRDALIYGAPEINMVDEVTRGRSIDEQIGEATDWDNYLTMRERAEKAIVEAKNAAADMAAGSTNDDDKNYWNGVANGLQTIQKNGNWDITDRLEINKGAAFSAQNSILYINQNWLNDNDHDYLIGAILHEGAHYDYDIAQGHFAVAWAKANGRTEAQEPGIYKPWHAKSEAYAWKGTIQYFDKNKPTHNKNTNRDAVSGFRELFTIYNSNRNMNTTIDWVMKNWYPKLYYWWKP
jgi:RHS repeat-associated protein